MAKRVKYESGTSSSDETEDDKWTFTSSSSDEAEDKKITFTDCEMKKVLKNLSEEKLVEVVTNRKRLLPIGRCAIKDRYYNQIFKLSNKIKPNSVDLKVSTKMIQVFGN